MTGITNRPQELEDERQQITAERREQVERQPGSVRSEPAPNTDKAHQQPLEVEDGKVSDTGYLLDTGQGRV